jgi:hypothetical protein
LSFAAVPLLDMLSDGDGVLGDMLLELLDVLPDGDVLDALDDELVSVDGVEGLIVLLLLELDEGEVLGDIVDDDELDVAGGVVEGVVVVDDVLLVSRWQPAAVTARAMASTANGFGFMSPPETDVRGSCAASFELAGSVPWPERASRRRGRAVIPLPIKAFHARPPRASMHRAPARPGVFADVGAPSFKGRE